MSIAVPSDHQHLRLIRMEYRIGDITATTGITLGGVAIRKVDSGMRMAGGKFCKIIT
jgi:hypothetical protein